MTFKEIFAEYFSQYRGQATNVPTFGDREFTVAIHNCNKAIRKWARVDGQLWRELYTTFKDNESKTSDTTITTGKTTYDAPSNMRKPPQYVSFYDSDGFNRSVTIKPYELERLNELTNMIVFTGGANEGYKMVISDRVAEEYNGKSIDYVYVKQPTILSVSTDPSNTTIEMSDPNYAVQEMLASRFINSRNGFGYRTASSEASIALINMKIENESGDWSRADNLRLDRGWGTNPDKHGMSL